MPRHFITILVLLVAGGAAACAGPRGFVATPEPPAISIELREGMTYDEGWERVHQVVQGQATVGLSSKEEGILETAWRTDRSYRVRAVIAFTPDRRTVKVRSQAEYGRPERRKMGYDPLFLDTLADALRAAVGRAPQGVERPDSPAPRPVEPGQAGGPDPGIATVAFGAHVDFWFPSIDGQAKATERSASGTWVEFEDGGIEDHETIPFLRLELTTRPRKRYYAGAALSLWSFSGSGSGILGEPEVIGGETFPAGTPVESSFRFGLLGLAGVFGWRATEQSPWALEFTPGLQFYRSRFELESAVERESAHFDTFGFGTGVRGEWHPIQELFISGKLEGYLPIFGGMGQAEFAGGGELGPLRVELGYRWFYLDHAGSVTRSRESLRLSLGGPFLGVTLRF